MIGDDSILHETEVEEEINENYDEIVEEEKEISQPNIQDTFADQEKGAKFKSNYLIELIADHFKMIFTPNSF